MATRPEGIPVASVGDRDGVPDNRALTKLQVLGKDWSPLLVAAVTVLGAFAAGLGWIDSRMGSRMDRMERRLVEIEARMDRRLDGRLGEFDTGLDKRLVEFETRMDRRLVEFEARMDRRLDQRLEEFEARFDQRLEEFEARFEQRFAVIDARFESMDQRLLRLEAIVLDISERLARVEGHLGIPTPGGGEAGPGP